MASNSSDQGAHAWKHVRLQLSHMEPAATGGIDATERRASDAGTLATPLMESRMSPMMSPALDGLPSTASVSMLRLPSGVFHYSKPGMWRSEEYHKQRFEDHDKSVFSTTSSHRPLDVIYERSALVRSRIPGSSKSLYNDMSVFAQSQVCVLFSPW
jgi:hypothetical protein